MPVEKERKHDSTTCVCNKCGIEGRENGRFAAAERERREESRISKEREWQSRTPSRLFPLGHAEGKRKPFLITTRYLLPTAIPRVSERARDFHIASIEASTNKRPPGANRKTKSTRAGAEVDHGSFEPFLG